MLALSSAVPVSSAYPTGNVEVAVKIAMTETGAKGVALALIEHGKVVSVRTSAKRGRC